MKIWKSRIKAFCVGVAIGVLFVFGAVIWILSGMSNKVETWVGDKIGELENL